MGRAVILLLLISLPAIIVCDDASEEATTKHEHRVETSTVHGEEPEPLQNVNELVLQQSEVKLPPLVSDVTVGTLSAERNLYFSESEANFFRAQQHCRTQGMHLVTIVNDAQNQLLHNEMKSRRLSKVWIGMNDLPQDKRWSWVGPGFYANYTQWDQDDDQPDGGEHCVIMIKGGDWHDYKCREHKFHYVCEK